MFCASLRPLLFTVGALASQETIGERTERRCMRTRYSAYLHPGEPVEYSFKAFMFHDDLWKVPSGLSFADDFEQNCPLPSL